MMRITFFSKIILVIVFFLFFTNVTANGVGEFRVSNYGSGTQTGNNFYRGYRFQVSQETVVTHLIGGGNAGNFIIGLYESTMNGAKVRPTNLLGFVTATGSTAEQVIQLASSVTLVPGQDYVLAQGRSSGSGSHYYVNNLNVQDLLDGSPRINFWEPTTNTSIRWNGGGDQNFIVNQDHLDFDGAMPRVGFLYLSDVNLPEVTTGSVAIDGTQVSIDGNLSSAGNGDTVVYVEIATTSDFSNGILYLSGNTGEDNFDFSTNFTPNGGALYYYRSVAINEAGRVNGSSASFRVYSLNYTAGANGQIQGPAEQLILPNGEGLAVTAVPTTAGYVFTSWSDGSLENPRIDTSVTQNRSVTASFEIPPTYTVEYSATTGGSILGELNQIVEPGSDSTTVTAVVDAGYYFAGWSDGVETLERTDVNIMSDINVVAQFGIVTQISNIETGSGEAQIDITWNTNSLNSSSVQYGLTTQMLQQTTEKNVDTRVQNHVVSLSNLAMCSRYYYRVISRDEYNTVNQSGVQTFLTNGCDILVLDGAGNEATIDEVEGGVVEFQNNQSFARLIIPHNYSNESASFQINKLVLENVDIPFDGVVIDDNIFNLVAKKDSNSELVTNFDNPVEFVLEYSNEAVQTYQVGSFAIRRFNVDTQEWDILDCDHNINTKTITCSLSSFSVYGLFGLSKQQQQSNVGGSRVVSTTLSRRLQNLALMNNNQNLTLINNQSDSFPAENEISYNSVNSQKECSSHGIFGLVNQNSLVRRGVRGENALGVQKAVNQLNVLSENLTLDSWVGSKTVEGIQKVQDFLNIEVDGLWGRQTQEAYRSWIESYCKN